VTRKIRDPRGGEDVPDQADPPVAWKAPFTVGKQPTGVLAPVLDGLQSHADGARDGL
jgi:hypothetical protein